MRHTIFEPSFKNEIVNKLRTVINENIHLTSNMQVRVGNNKRVKAWDKICAILDRLQDTLNHINSMKLNTGKYAFDFMDFMNHSGVVVECVSELAKVFEVELKISSKEIFNQVGSDGKGNDYYYFQYLRSLCSVHPVETSRHKSYQANKFECSPYIIWNNRPLFIEDTGDLVVIVYTSNEDNLNKRIQVKIDDIFRYIESVLCLIEKVIEKIEYNNEVFKIEQSKSELNPKREFSTYKEYIEYLIIKDKERFHDNSTDYFEEIIDYFDVLFSNEDNQVKWNKYIKALKYAIGFEHYKIQTMNLDGFNSTGIKEGISETTLLWELVYPHCDSEFRIEYNYFLEKYSLLKTNCSEENREFVLALFEETKSYLEKYVSFEGVQLNREYYLLIKLALYFESLENESLINSNIPKSNEFR